MDGKCDDLVVLYVFVQDIQKNLAVGVAGGIGHQVLVRGVRLGDQGTGLPGKLRDAGEAVLGSIALQIVADLGPRLADDVHVYGEPAGRVQMEHQGGTAFEDKGAAGAHQGFQQGESPDGLLQQGCVFDVGILGAEGFNPLTCAAFGVNHGPAGLCWQVFSVWYLNSFCGEHSGAGRNGRRSSCGRRSHKW